MLNMGILGCGIIAATMAKTVNRMNEAGDSCCRLYAAASRDSGKATAFAREYGIPMAYGSYEDMLNDPKVDLVYIATPHACHMEQALLCGEHGKHVLCEKAFAGNARQAEKMLDLFEKKGLLITEAIWTRYQPMRRIIDECIASGVVGKAQTLTANLSYPLTHAARITQPALAGGALLDVGVYAINFSLMHFGVPASVNASAILMPTGVDQTISITMTYDDGRMSILSAGSTAQSDRFGMIWCTDGYIRVRNINNPQQIEAVARDERVVFDRPCPPQLTGYEYEVIEAVRAINEGKTECDAMPHRETMRVMEIMDAIRLQTGVRYPFD